MSNARAIPRETIPPLESGDVLTRAEFERRYDADPRVKRAELIDGVVYVASPIRAKYHGDPQAAIIGWLGLYASRHPEVRVSGNSSLRLEGENETQPDASLRKEHAGSSRIDEEGYIEGAPELVVEIAASSASYDLHQKLELYRRNGVQEYIVWRVFDAALDWFELRDGEYVGLAPDESGVIESHVFPGLRLAVAKLLGDDLAGVLASLG